ncbi:DUF3320 domain-containing protein [Actinoplanes utahensis]|uniref:Regulator n=1 Tax=Actinoplanes utahensis TaxID=1869 RepID=A0A0A6X990_ACTUT|nr:DUF3320 domain-containing protein [Actinoplanes utahensis]KHD76687.1 regulator [Actinoplanes utahensis]GIF33258.1 hypothetical protein Aut01nite_62440 [Actinoplanes utahensis]
MRPDDAEGHTGPGDDARAALAAWREGIVGTGGANRLINLPRGGSDLVEIVSPDPAGVVEALRHGRDCALSGTSDKNARRGGKSLRADLPDGVLQPLLRRLRRHAQQEQADRGVDVLYVAIGLLHWQDTDGGYASPLLLIPAELVTLGPGDLPRLRAGTGDPLVNPALAARLRGLGVILPEVGDLAGLDVADLTARIGQAVEGRTGWRTSATAVLARFDPAAEAIRRDLIENEDRVLAHPVVRALAESDSAPGAFTFEPVARDEIDVLAPPDEVPLVLDADAAQRACVAAALEGHSFVVDGPPGTGKSQTIANMIGALAHAGKRVLFVSEKATALDTVAQRLAAAGLGNYLLDLHGPRASRKQVAGTLAAALEAMALPAPGMDEPARELLRERREQLNAYARALTEPREPLGRTLHEIIGRFARLADVPEAPAPALHAAALTDEALDRIRDAAARLTHAWRPALERGGFRWREVAETEPLAEALAAAQSALESLAAAAAINAPIAAAFHLRLPTDAAQLSEISEHAAQRPPGVADQWLTATSLRPIRLAAEELAQRLEVSRRAADAVRHRAGVAGEVLAAPLDIDTLPEPPRLDPPAVRLEPLTAAEAKALSGRFAADADELEHQQRNLDRATSRLGLPDVITFSDVELVHLIAELGARPDKPEPAWFAPGSQSAVHAAAGALRLHVDAANAARTAAGAIFTDAVLREPVEELAERFATVHRGARKLLAPHRRDKETVAALIQPDVAVDEAIAELPLAVGWRRAHEGLVAAERQHAGLLGRYWKRLDTDFPAIGRALQTAAEVLRVTPPEALSQVVEYVCGPQRSNADELHRAVTEARDVFRHWRSTLRPEPEAAGRPELGHGPVQHAVAWMRAQVAPLRDTAAVLRQLGDAVGRDLNVAEAAGVIEVRQGMLDAEHAFAAATHSYETTLGPVFQGKQTDLRAIEDAIEWTAHTRTLRTGTDAALNHEQAAAMTAGRPAPDLTPAIEAWQDARQRILDAFGPARQVRLGTALDRYETARDLLRDLLDDESGQREWFDYLAARGVLAEYGLDTVVDYCADHSVDVERLGDVLERTAYRAWIDRILAEDERLHPLAAAERDELAAEFRRLDAELLPDAAGRVIEALNARRPVVTDGGGPAQIRAEGGKPDGHLPVRDQLAAAWDTVAALKPCMLMPPAAVSRLLPDQAVFDVVVIDEASRMAPAAAAACAYRGTSLVIVGDDAQLPPAGDQPSVLVVANDCGAFTRLALTNHYRSRHESLIAFANQAFYQNRLVTFPTAHPAGPDLGVELYAAAPDAEARQVAERVLHHLTTRPSLSLGVVTLTAAHADEIADAVEVTLAGRPDLEGFLGDFVVEGADAAQGDERDVIILSTGADLGAAGGPTGARRLDVAITRARQRVEVVSAISAADREEPGGEGERRLAAYLDFAEHGVLPGDAREPSPIEQSVLAALDSWGIPAEPVRFGIGVRNAGAYVLGVLFDGPGEDNARDRDRLQDQVLAGLGWHLHRMWSVAWHTDRSAQEARLRVAVENALATPDVFAEIPDETLTVRPAQLPEWALPYERAVVAPLPAAARFDDEVARRLLIRTVEQIAEVEGPVHVGVLTRRIREAWGLSRLTQQVKAAIETAIRSSRAGFDGTFVTAADAPIPAVRVPGDGVTRKPDQVADAELQLALEYLVLDAGLVEGEDLLAAAGRLFGWSGSRTGAARLAAMLDDLVEADRLIAHRNGLIAAPENDLLDLPDPATLPRRATYDPVRL